MPSEPREVWGDLPTSAFIQSSHLFKSLDDESREDLLHLARLQIFAAGEPVFRQGEAGDDFFLVRDGTAVITAGAGKAAKELGHLEKGAFFGEACVLTGQARKAGVSARTELSVVRFPAPMI